jgi:hypothetical protein
MLKEIDKPIDQPLPLCIEEAIEEYLKYKNIDYLLDVILSVAELS